MEKRNYISKFFEEINSSNDNLLKGVGADLINGVRRILNKYNAEKSYEFMLEDFSRTIITINGSRNVMRAESPHTVYHVVWGDTEFNQNHHEGNFDCNTAFMVGYGVLNVEDDGLGQKFVTENRELVCNITILDDDTGKFDTKACSDIYSEIDLFFANYCSEREDRFSYGLSIYGTKPSYVATQEEIERAKRKAQNLEDAYIEAEGNMEQAKRDLERINAERDAAIKQREALAAESFSQFIAGELNVATENIGNGENGAIYGDPSVPQ